MSKFIFIANVSTILVLATSCRMKNASGIRDIAASQSSGQSEIFDPDDLGCVCEVDPGNSGTVNLSHYTNRTEVQKKVLDQFADLDSCVAKKLENSTGCLLSF